MIKPRIYGEYVGFTEKEVRSLCTLHHADFSAMKLWYGGYGFKEVGPVYNPNSVMKALRYRDFDSYWTQTSAAEGLIDYISRDYKGLKRMIAELIGGVEVPVNPVGFANDLTTFKSSDDILTLLIHLGYLAYDADKKTVQIPNEKIKLAFQARFTMARSCDRTEVEQICGRRNRANFAEALPGSPEEPQHAYLTGRD